MIALAHPDKPFAMLAPKPHPRERARLDTIADLGLMRDEVEESITRAVRLLSDCIGVPIAALSVVGNDRQRLISKVGISIEETARDVSFCGHTLLDTDLFVVSDARTDERFADNPLVIGDPGIRFYSGIAVNAPNGLPIGALCAIDTRPRELTETQIRQFNDIKFLIEDILQFRALSMRDALTGLFNRRYFDEMLGREWRRSLRHTLPLSAMMVDIDHFKRYNDHYGHPEGDRCLKAVAAMLRAQVCRAGDHLARYGGEEFVLILPETPLAGALVMAERLRNAIVDARWEHAGSPFGHITVSIGAATIMSLDSTGSDAIELIRLADECLYRAKAAGRNCTRGEVVVPNPDRVPGHVLGLPPSR